MKKCSRQSRFFHRAVSGYFTLIELLAAMAVFSVLLLLSIRLFTGAQDLWLRSEQKTAAFANARVAMEFVASRIQSYIYYVDVPFYIKNDSSDKRGRIWFASRMQLGNSSSNSVSGRRFFQFSLVDPKDKNDREAGNLQLRIFSGRKEQKFGWVFPAYGEDNRFFKDFNAAFNYVNNKLQDSNRDDDTIVDVAENVTEFNLTWYNSKDDGEKWSLEKMTSDEQKTPPYLVEVEIRMLDSKDHFKAWQDKPADRDEIFAQYGYTFRRAILLGKK